MLQHLCLATLLFFSISKNMAQPAPNSSPLHIEQIMQGEAFTGYLPENISWSEDSRTIWFSWNPEKDTLRSTWKLHLLDGKPQKPEKATDEELKTRAGKGNYDKARTRMTYHKNGDLFLLDLASGSKFQITNTLEYEHNPRFSGDDTKILFDKDDNLFTWDIATGAVEQLTDFKKGNERKERKKSPQDQWLEEDQLHLFDVLAGRKAKEDLRKRQQDALKPQRPKAFYLGEKRMLGLEASPDLNFITFRLIKSSEAEQTQVPSYVTASGRVEILKSRPKVGTLPNGAEMGIYDRQRDTIYFVETKHVEGIYDKPAFLKQYHKDTLPYQTQYNTPRPLAFANPIFSEDGKALLVARAQDNKDRWLLLLDLPSGELKLLDRQHDEAWIGGPGIGGWSFSTGNTGWLPDNQHIWFQSEESGYSHLYSLNVQTGEKKALTSGNFEILNAFLSRDKKFFYITANKETPFEQHFYKMPASGGTLEKITTLPGRHEVVLSPDEKWLALRYSFSNKPWELYLMPNRPGAAMQQLTSSTTADFQKYPWREPELVWFKASDGADVPARLYRPRASRRNGAAVIFVHGAGYLQNVHRWWSSYSREFMFHNLLADNGYTVLDIDYRGSSGYGRNWRTAIYRHMGGRDLADHLDGARYLVETHGIDAHRIGIYGGSYGGFITLMALFTSPGTFKCGAALRSVTDWAHYNQGYTANILNTPLEDSLAYRHSSPIYFAQGLQDHLLILHGMVDANVEFQDVVRLSQRLIELKKENWELAVFPVEDHGFVEPDSWTDEYRRIFKFFQKTLIE